VPSWRRLQLDILSPAYRANGNAGARRPELGPKPDSVMILTLHQIATSPGFRRVYLYSVLD